MTMEEHLDHSASINICLVEVNQVITNVFVLKYIDIPSISLSNNEVIQGSNANRSLIDRSGNLMWNSKNFDLLFLITSNDVSSRLVFFLAFKTGLETIPCHQYNPDLLNCSIISFALTQVLN